MKRYGLYLLTVGMTLVLLLNPLSNSVAGMDLGHGMGAQSESTGMPAILLQPMPGTAIGGEPIIVDCDTVSTVPQEFCEAIEGALLSGRSLLPPGNRFTVAAFRTWGDWFEATLVPTEVVEAAWEVDLTPEQIVEVLGRRSNGGAYSAGLRGTPQYSQLASQTPTEFIDFGVHPLAISATYLFPWTSGQTWYKTRGWHYNSVDFAPATSSSPARDYAVLAAAPGTLRETCNDGVQAILRIEHDDGNTTYTHMDAGTVQRNLIGQHVSGGRFLGLLYAGNVINYQCPFVSNPRFSTACGCGTGVHLHFTPPSTNTTIDGRNINDVANSGNGSRYTSSNQRVDGDGGGSQNCADGEGVVLYEHSNYTGRCTRFTGDDNNLGDNPIGNDAASSIRVIGNFEAIVYEHSDYGGTSTTFTGDDPDFGNDAIGHDRASSIRVRRRDAGGSSNCDGGQGVYLYEHSSYGGRCSKFTGDAPNPRNWYIGNDAASSIRIIGNYEATVYEHDDYNGASSTFTGDDPDFGNDSIGHDRASSIRVRQRSSGSSNCDGGQGVYLYEHPNYTGRCSKFTSDAPNPRDWYLGNDAASSIRFVGNYEATVYEHDDYNGTSSTFTSDDPDFGNDSIGHDRVSSIRVRQGSSGPTSCADGQFLAEYFSNRDLSGSPTFRRCEGSVDADWGYSGPGSGVGGDNFSIRWNGRIWFDEGVYRLTTRTDDGVRFWLDGQLLIDQWRDMGATEFPVERQIGTGWHTLRMEYYERGGYATARLSWQRRQSVSDSDDGRTIGYDSGLDGTVNPSGDRDDYYFEGSAGQAITIRMDKRDSNLDSYVELYNPDGTLLGQDDDSGGNLNSRLAITLRQNGRHKIIARGYSTSTGGYRISLSRESTADADDNRWIAFGSTLQGTISPNNDRDWYYFSGVAGRVVSIRMNKIDSSLDSYLELYNPSGVKVAENDDGGGDRNSWLVYTLPESGVYRIMARSWNLASSGQYNLLLSLASNGNLALRRVAYATSTEFNGVEPYKAFDGNIGTRWSSRFSDPQFIYVDLGATRTFNQVVLRWETAYGRSYGIYYWTGNSWRNIYWTNSGDGGNDTITFTPVQARYVGMYGTQRGTPWGYSLWEFEIYDNTTVPLPEVPPDPGDKPPEEGVDPLVPLPPNDEGKPTVLVGDGIAGQEDMPLSDTATVTPTSGTSTGIPVAHILYPRQNDPAGGLADEILFQCVASDNDEDGASIVEYRWLSDLDGPIGSTDTFTLTRSSLTRGTHVITLEVRDNEGVWSEPVTTILTTEFRVYLPLIVRK